MNNEPVAIGTAINSFAAALFAVLIGFGIVDWTSEQVGLLLALLTAVNVLIGSVVRRKVTPVISGE